MCDGGDTEYVPNSSGATPGQNLQDSTEARLLHVEDDDAFGKLTAEFLARLAPNFTYTAAKSVDAALTRFDTSSFDAVLCDYDLPDGTGIDVLKDVRRQDDGFPFILYTGKGSEEIASEAISAGVTDYLQKRGGSDQFEMLTNRLQNAIETHRLQRQVERGIAALEAAAEPIGILDSDGTYLFANEAYASVYGLSAEALFGTHWKRLYPDSEVTRFSEDILPRLKADGHWRGEAVGTHVTGSAIRERLELTHTRAGGHVCIIRESKLDDE